MSEIVQIPAHVMAELRQAEIDALREQNRVLANALKLCVERLEGLKEDGITKAEQHALDAAQAALTATSQEGQHG